MAAAGLTENDTLEIASLLRPSFRHAHRSTSNIRKKCEEIHTNTMSNKQQQLVHMTHTYIHRHTECMNSPGGTFNAHMAPTKVKITRKKGRPIVRKTNTSAEMHREKYLQFLRMMKKFSFSPIAFIFGHSSFTLSLLFRKSLRERWHILLFSVDVVGVLLFL